MKNNKKPAPSDPASDEITNKIEIFSTSDAKIKFLGEMFSNESSREILSLLIEKEMTTNEISQKTELSLSLVIHHLNKMMNAEIVNITRTSQNSKGQEMKHYRAKSAILIFPAASLEKAKKSKTLSNSLKKVLSFAIVGIAGITTWFSTHYTKTQKITEVHQEIITKPGEITDFTNASSLNKTTIQVEELASQSGIFIPFMATAIVIGLGLFLIWFSKK